MNSLTIAPYLFLSRPSELQKTLIIGEMIAQENEKITSEKS